MFERFGTPAFLREARGGKEKDPRATLFRTLLFFLLVYMIGGFLQSSISLLAESVALFLNPALRAMIPTEIPSELLAETLTDAEQSAMLQAWLDGWFPLATAYAEQFLLSSGVRAVAQIFGTAVFAVAAVIFCRLIEKRSFGSMGIRRAGAGGSLLVGAGMGVLLLGFAVGFAIVYRGVAFQGIAPLRPGMLCFLAVGILLESLAEELLFRGYLMVSLSRRHSLIFGAIVSSLLFTLLHATYGPVFSWVGFLNLFLFGFLMALVTVRTGNLLGAVALHALFAIGEGVVIGTPYYGAPLPASLLSFASPDRYAVIGGGVAGLSGGIAVTCALLLGIAFLLGQKTKEN